MVVHEDANEPFSNRRYSVPIVYGTGGCVYSVNCVNGVNCVNSVNTCMCCVYIVYMLC